MTNEDPLISMLDKPSDYERMVCHGMWAIEGVKHMRQLMDGQRVRAYVPTPLVFVGPSESAKTMECEIVQFRAEQIDGGRYTVSASLRPWQADAWIDVGRID